jgi:hypothetical protein
MGPFDFLFLRIAVGEKYAKSTKWDWRYGMGILLAASVTLVLLHGPPFIEKEFSVFRLWLKVLLYGCGCVGFAIFCGRFVPALVSGLLVFAIWLYYFL